MEFEALSELFKIVCVAPLKRKYPMVVSYMKHLEKVKNTDHEVDCFKQFLIANQNLHEKKFDEPNFRGSKKAVVIYMPSLVELSSEDVVEKFWEQLYQCERLMFPNGKPEKIATSSIGDILATNAVLRDVVGQVKDSVDMMDETDLGRIMQSPDFANIVNNIQKGITSGKYTMSDLIGTINSVVQSVKDDLPPESRSTMDTVTQTMSAIEKGETPDMGAIMKAISDLQGGGASNFDGLESMMKNLKL